MIRSILQNARRFTADTRGAIAMQFAAMAVVLTFAAGFAVDYSMSRSADDKLQSAADSAVLAAVDNLSSFKGAGDAALQQAASAQLKKYFEAAITQFPNYHVTYTPNVTAHNGHIVAALNYSASMTTTFANLIGISKINLFGTASAESAQPVFVAIYALVDASGSMGIGASSTDQALMQKHMNCTLACHIDGTQIIAHNLGASLRFDIVKNALSSIIKASGSKAIMAGQFRFAVSKFSNDITQITPVTSDATKAAQAVDGMDLDDPQYGPAQGMGTNFAQSLNNFYKTLPAGGDGSSPNSPLVYVLIMTDGVSDDVDEQIGANGLGTGHWVVDPNWDWFPTVYGSGERFAGFNPALCDQLKQKGRSVMTLDMEYVIPNPIPDDRYTVIQNNLKSTIQSNLQKCASQVSFAYSASSPADIQAAINNMFETAIKSAHLSS